MANQNDNTLYRLIHSLSQPEKVKFSKTLKIGLQKSQLEKLFHTISKTTEPKDDIVKEKLKTQIKTGSFPVLKNKLKTKLLDWLTNHNSADTLVQLNVYLIQIDVLFKRGLFEEALNTCNKMERLAIQLEYFSFVVQAQYWKSSIDYIVNTEVTDSLYKQMAEKSSDAVQKWLFNDKAKNLYSAAVSMFVKNPCVRENNRLNAIHVLMQDEMFSKNHEAPDLPFFGACYLAMSKRFIWGMLGKHELLYELDKFIYDKINNDIEFNLKQRQNQTVSTFINFASTLVVLGCAEEFQSVCRVGEKVLRKTTLFEYYSCSIRILEIQLMVIKDKWNMNKEDGLKLSKILNQDNMKTYPQISMFIPFYGMLGMFYTQNFEQALYYAHEFRNLNTKLRVRADMDEICLFIINVVSFVQYILDSNSFKKFENQITSYKSHLKNKPISDDYSLEKLFAEMFFSIKKNTALNVISEKLVVLEKKVNIVLSNPSPAVSVNSIHIDYKGIINFLEKVTTA